ncbi:MAG: cytochrome c biogenesis protein ResB [Deltaproteobacteria bacterium]|nr:cytochrome c biogenesis protein ResB [Deltaproteobacteria bacterium]
MKQPKSENRSHAIWRFFSSVKLTIVLLILLAIVSIIGTVIPQQQGAAEFARRLSPSTLQIFAALDMFDMYHSIWFRVLIGFLALNLIVCSADRFPRAWKRFTTRPEPDRTKPFDHLPPDLSCRTDKGLKETADSVGRLLQSRYKRIREKEVEGNRFFYAEKGGYSHFGVYIVHLSVLLILVGGLVGSFFGFEAYVNILEGEQTDTVMLRKKMEPMKLNFSVRCDKFTVDFYKNGAPREFRSDLGFLVNGKEVKRIGLLVNHPVEFMGVMFYQAHYGKAPGKAVHLNISRQGHGSPAVHMTVQAGDAVELPGGEGVFKVVDVRGDIMNMGPAALISVQPEKQGKPLEFWVFKNQEQALNRLPGPMRQSSKFNPSAFAPYTFFLDGVETRYYTGLQVNKDPGVPIVWIGCFFMVAGLFFTFFTSHRRIWVRVLDTGQGIQTDVAGSANKNPVGLQRELEHLVKDIRKLA